MRREVFEPEIEEYLSLKKKPTRGIYATAFSKFLDYYRLKHGKEKGVSHFLDRIFEEFKKPLREQRRIAEIEVKTFIDYLRDSGLSNNSIRVYFAAVQNFLKYKQVVVSMSFIDMPAPLEKKINGKHEWNIKQIKEFVDAAPSYRDKAIILCMFQSGMAVNEICNLNYDDVQDEFEKGILPLCLKLVRKKTKVEFKTFFGRDAVKYLRLYLDTRKDLKALSPLFAKLRKRGGESRITAGAIQQSFSEIAVNLDFVKLKGGFNPARPHSLRAAFNSRLIGKIDETLREFWMGHTIGSVSKAYLAMPTEDLRKLYMMAEEFLKIERSSSEEIEDRRKEPIELEKKVKLLSDEVKTLKEQINQMYEFTHKNFNPIVELFNEIMDTSEGQAARDKVLEKKMRAH